MISREEAIATASDDDFYWVSVINTIYNSIGSCGECKYFYDDGICKLHSKDANADVVMMDSDFCNYFERKINGTDTKKES